MNRCLVVSAGMLTPKKSDDPLSRAHRYLNYGALSLATRLSACGYEVLMLHGNFEPPENTGRAAVEFLCDTRGPILLSLPSSFAITWARAFVACVRMANPRVDVIVGGRWVVDGAGAWIRAAIPGTDLVVYGTAEGRVEALVDRKQWSSVAGTDRTDQGLPEDSTPSGLLDFRLMPDYSDYQPCIDVSRGCGMGCAFCVERQVPASQLKGAELVAEEMSQLDRLYGRPAIHPYLQASIFRPTSRWAHELERARAERGVSLQWRCETRVDAMKPDTVKALARAGLRVLDVGLESCSPLQLRAMGKTVNPELYLRRADELLRTCRDAGVLVKVNILLYAGESDETFKATTVWLRDRNQYILGISAYPVILYRFPGWEQHLSNLRVLGASLVDSNAMTRDGYAHLHLSPSFPHDRSVRLCAELTASLMSQDARFFLKSFSYLPRSMSRVAFDAMTSISTPSCTAI